MNFKKLSEYIDSLPLAGIPYLDIEVRNNNETVFRKWVGNSDRDREKPLAGNEIYSIASCSKIATCLGALKLIEEGSLSPNTPVSDFFPEYGYLTVKDGDSAGYAKKQLSVESLFLMGAGWGYDVLKQIRPSGRGDNIEFAKALANVPMAFEPGTDFVYGLSLDVLAGVIEKVTGLRLGEYLKKTLFDPLGMYDTGFYLTDEQRRRLPTMYMYDSRMNEASPMDSGDVRKMLVGEWEQLGGSGLFSTVSDYSRLLGMAANSGLAFDGVQLLKPETIALCTKNRLERKQLVSARSSVLSYGYGWGLCGRVHMDGNISRSRSPEGEFGWNGATATYALADTKNRVSMFVGMQALGCFYMVDVVHNMLRDLAYEAMNI